MYRLLCLILLSVSLLASAAPSGELTLQGYQRADGAITVRLNGDTVDPYFASKALLGAADARLDAKKAALAWIDWALAHQSADGRFDRFCLRSGRYVACATADADDAMLAVWMELLVRFAPAGGLPRAWDASLQKASTYLFRLYDRQSGVFVISRTLPIALLMDNVEVYSAFRALARYHFERGNDALARLWITRADQLQVSVNRVFWSPPKQFRVSTQQRSTSAFYPDTVAQIFPVLADLPIPGKSRSEAYAEWMAANRDTWLRQATDDFPWGMVALLSDKMGDRKTIACWRARAVPFRHGTHWNVLEEALYLAFEARLSSEEKLAPAC
jgi:hypothetical protein